MKILSNTNQKFILQSKKQVKILGGFAAKTEKAEKSKFNNTHILDPVATETALKNGQIIEVIQSEITKAARIIENANVHNIRDKAEPPFIRTIKLSFDSKALKLLKQEYLKKRAHFCQSTISKQYARNLALSVAISDVFLSKLTFYIMGENGKESSIESGLTSYHELGHVIHGCLSPDAQERFIKYLQKYQIIDEETNAFGYKRSFKVPKSATFIGDEWSAIVLSRLCSNDIPVKIQKVANDKGFDSGLYLSVYQDLLGPHLRSGTALKEDLSKEASFFARQLEKGVKHISNRELYTSMYRRFYEPINTQLLEAMTTENNSPIDIIIPVNKGARVS
ncbi:MAG: hypothetical protein QNJ31_07120 [Candidatus Caenarcaniphilales bacterium]|nr:hypothetical protein [Candidatus Caenarcaniphilales bacterium]